MKIYDVTELALRNLRESVLRNSLTTVGISVGVASLVAMLSLGIGLQRMASQRLERSGLFDTVLVTSRRDMRNFNRGREESGPAPAESPALNEDARKKLEQLPSVREAYPDIRFFTELRYQGKPHISTVAGLPPSARTNDAFEGMAGSYFSSDSAPEAILQKSFATELLDMRTTGETKVAALAPKLIGQDLAMRYTERSDSSSDPASYSVVSRQQTLKIVGITDLDPDNMSRGNRAQVFLPLGLAQRLRVMQPSDLRDVTGTSGSSPSYSTVSVRVKSPADIEAVETSIKKMGFNTFSIVDATRSMQRFFAVLDLFLGIFGSLALAVASIGIVNTLVMAILERRREIGIMKALGASDSDVKFLFFTEAGVMGLLGGLVGVALGWSIGRAINLGTNIYLKRQNFPAEEIWFVPWWLVLGAIAFAIIVSLLSGLYPASRASKLDPVQALRYE
jgi:putative ABC transport system permease protein